MPIPLFAWTAGSAIAALAATVFFWETSSRGVKSVIWSKIVEYIKDFLLAILEKYAPSLAPLVEEAFIILDKVATGIRMRAKRAWSKIRQYVIALYNDYSYRDGRVLQKTVMFTKSETKGKFKEHVTEREISRDDLPESVRTSLLCDRTQPVRVDIRSIQDDNLDIDDDAEVNFT